MTIKSSIWAIIALFFCLNIGNYSSAIADTAWGDQSSCKVGTEIEDENGSFCFWCDRSPGECASLCQYDNQMPTAWIYNDPKCEWKHHMMQTGCYCIIE